MKRISFNDPLAKEILVQGKVLAFPTETVFGLGVRYDDKDAFDELVKVKLRAPDKPFTLMCGNKEDIQKYAYLDDKIKKVIDKFMPGPITLLLKPKDNLPSYVTLNSGKIGVRVPGLIKLCDLIDEVGVPLLVPSANKAGGKPALDIEEVIKVFDEEIEAVVEGKISKDSVPSTIIDLSDPLKVTLIRPGEINIKDIEEVYYS